MDTGEFRLRNIPVDNWEKFKAIVREESVRLSRDYWPNDALLELIDRVVKRETLKEGEGQGQGSGLGTQCRSGIL